MTPSQQTIQKIRDAITQGTMADAEKALEDFVVSYDEWKVNTMVKDILLFNECSIPYDNRKRYQLFNQTKGW